MERRPGAKSRASGESVLGADVWGVPCWLLGAAPGWSVPCPWVALFWGVGVALPLSPGDRWLGSGELLLPGGVAGGWLGVMGDGQLLGVGTN